MAKIAKSQIIKSLVFAAIGATPGLIWFFNARTGQSILITCLCTFIAFAFSLPGVSAARVLAGTAGAIVANNVPRSMQGKVVEAFVGENDACPDAPVKSSGSPEKS